jgi:A/G-specific adenine glycosylase
VDTNIRRVHARLISGQALPAPALTASETRLAQELLPADRGTSVAWNASVMELGALICTARSPKCGLCPVRDRCAWIAAGEPGPTYTPMGQTWAGTDRQVRGAIMAVLRAAQAPVHRALFSVAPVDLRHGVEAGPDAVHAASLDRQLATLHGLAVGQEQLDRALDGLLQDGLAQARAGGFQLPN